MQNLSKVCWFDGFAFNAIFQQEYKMDIAQNENGTGMGICEIQNFPISEFWMNISLQFCKWTPVAGKKYNFRKVSDWLESSSEHQDRCQTLRNQPQIQIQIKNKYKYNIYKYICFSPIWSGCHWSRAFAWTSSLWRSLNPVSSGCSSQGGVQLKWYKMLYLYAFFLS